MIFYGGNIFHISIYIIAASLDGIQELCLWMDGFFMVILQPQINFRDKCPGGFLLCKSRLSFPFMQAQFSYLCTMHEENRLEKANGGFRHGIIV